MSQIAKSIFHLVAPQAVESLLQRGQLTSYGALP